MAASADALLLFVPVAGDAPASSGALATLRRLRLARPKNDGGNNASADTNRTDAPRRRPLLEERGIQVWAIHTCLASELGLTAGFLNFFTENAENFIKSKVNFIGKHFLKVEGS